jgi:predicted ribosomally synthesized peptide with SipW-like signal peptide
MVLVSALAAACVLTGGTGSSLALFSDAASAGVNTLTAGYWSVFAVYLHNNPTPPTANTTAQYNLSATAVAPTATTLFRYDTNGANRAGRGIARTAAPGPGLTTALAYVNWLTPAFGSEFTIVSSATVDIWSATNTTAANRTGSLVVYLRDFNPSSGAYANVGSATYTATYRTGRTFYRTPVTVTMAAPYVLPAGHRLEVKIESPSGTAAADMLVAYDTRTYVASLTLS